MFAIVPVPSGAAAVTPKKLPKSVASVGLYEPVPKLFADGPEFVPGAQTAENQAVQFGFPQGSAVVAGLYVGSPALEAGMQRGDVITEIDGEAVRGAQDLLAHVAQLKPGRTIRITWLRGPPFSDPPRSMTVKLRVVEQPRRS